MTEEDTGTRTDRAHSATPSRRRGVLLFLRDLLVIFVVAVLVFPLVFVSNGFVEPDTLPAPLEKVVDLNPISHVITAARGLMDGTASAGEIGLVLAEALVLTLVFAPVTTRLYRTHA